MVRGIAKSAREEGWMESDFSNPSMKDRKSLRNRVRIRSRIIIARTRMVSTGFAINCVHWLRMESRRSSVNWGRKRPTEIKASATRIGEEDYMWMNEQVGTDKSGIITLEINCLTVSTSCKVNIDLIIEGNSAQR